MRHAAVLVDTDGEHQIVPLDEDVSGIQTCKYAYIMYIQKKENILQCLIFFQTDLTIVASFDRRGQNIYTGNAKGKILVLECPQLTLKASFKVTASATAVKSIEFARRGE